MLGMDCLMLSSLARGEGEAGLSSDAMSVTKPVPLPALGVPWLFLIGL